MAAVHELWGFHAFVAHEEVLKTFLVDGADGFGEVAEVFFLRKVYFFGREVGQDPGEDGVLGKVAEGSIASLVEMH
jgi:hypothetical protein